MSNPTWWIGNNSTNWGSYTHTFNPTSWSDNYTQAGWIIPNPPEQMETNEMTTLDKVHRERRERAERKRIEQQYELLDAMNLGELADGAVVRFDAVEPDDKRLTYAALHANNRWWATGGTAPNGVGLEDLLAWMIRKNVDAASIEKLS